MEPQKTLNIQSNLEKQEQSWRYHATWYPTVLQDHSNQDGTDIKTDTDNDRVDSTDINPCLHGRLIYDMEDRTVKGSKDSLFNQQCWETRHIHKKE